MYVRPIAAEIRKLNGGPKKIKKKKKRKKKEKKNKNKQVLHAQLRGKKKRSTESIITKNKETRNKINGHKLYE